jgi:hypothetical protein
LFIKKATNEEKCSRLKKDFATEISIYDSQKEALVKITEGKWAPDQLPLGDLANPTPWQFAYDPSRGTQGNRLQTIIQHVWHIDVFRAFIQLRGTPAYLKTRMEIHMGKDQWSGYILSFQVNSQLNITFFRSCEADQARCLLGAWAKRTQ